MLTEQPTHLYSDTPVYTRTVNTEVPLLPPPEPGEGLFTFQSRDKVSREGWRGRGPSCPVEVLSLIIWGSSPCCNPCSHELGQSAALPVGL